MTAVAAPVRSVISAWSAVSPFGIGRDAFAAGLHAGRSTAVPLDAQRWPTPFEIGCLVPEFDIKAVLGRKGTRSMDRATGLAVTAVGRLLEGDGPPRRGDVGDDAGLVLGTNSGSVQSIMDFTRDSLVQERPFFVDPARFPNTVMNCAAGQCAIWYQLRGPNTTIAAGRASGLLALNYALRLQRSGRAATVLCGAVEEFSVARSWLEWHSRDADERPGALGEGCAVLLLEQAEVPQIHGRRPLAEVAALQSRYCADASECERVLADCIGQACARAGVLPTSVGVVAMSQPAGFLGAAEAGAIDSALGAAERTVLRVGDLIGDTCAASAVFQTAAILAAAERDQALAGVPAVVTSVDHDGVVACMVLLLQPGDCG